MGETVKTIAKERVDEITKQTAEPAWLKDSRLKAFESYLKTPTPCNRDENWHRTEVDALDLAALNVIVSDSKEKAAGKEPDVIAKAFEHLGKKLPYIYTTPQNVEIGNVDSELLSKGVIFCSLKTALTQHADLLNKHLASEGLSKPDFAHNDKFYLMNQSLFNCGAFFYVPKNVILESPVLNVFTSGEDTSIAVFPRVIIIVEQGAKAEFVNISTSAKGGKSASEKGPLSLINSSIETVVGHGASLYYLDVSDFSDNTFAVSRVYNEVKKDASLHSSTIALGGWQIKSDIQTNLKEPGAKSDIRGVVLGAGSERYSFNTIQDHIAPDTSSTINFRVALKDSSSSAYLGTIRVSKEGQRTDSTQSNKNLLLGSDAHADSIPKLEILADDVKCSHGATVGPADKEQIFYLMSRGMDNLEAEELIVTGFFRQVVQSCPVDGAGDWINTLVAEKIHSSKQA